MTPNEYQEAAMRTNDRQAKSRLDSRLHGNMMVDLGEVLNASLGLSGEVGELNDMIKKFIFHGHDMEEVEFKKELGDICWYLALMCDACGYDLENIMQMNIDKLKRRYPVEFSEEQSQNRTE